MALYILVAEGYTDCALLEAILENCMGFERYSKVADMPELFQKLVGSYPSTGGEMTRGDMPHFYHLDSLDVVVKVAGGDSKIAGVVEGVLQAHLLCGDKKELCGFLVFTDADDRTSKQIHEQFRSWYKDQNIQYVPENEMIMFEQEAYSHSLYTYPQNGFGAVEKILLEVTQNLYPELSEKAMTFRNELMQAEFSDLRSKNWVADKTKQDFYADKVQFGAIASALKPDRPVGFAIKDWLIGRKKLDKLETVEEFQMLYRYLRERMC
jgi:hypothetical protein